MRLTKKQRDAQEREYAAEMDAIHKQVATEESERDAIDRASYAKYQRTHGGLFEDSYGDPVIHVPDYADE